MGTYLVFWLYSGRPCRRDQDQCPINQKLSQVSTSLETFLVSHINSTVEAMLVTAQELCPNTLSQVTHLSSISNPHSYLSSSAGLPPGFRAAASC